MSLTVVSRPELAVGAQFSRLISAIQAILYQFQREDFAVHTVNSDGGDARFLITGDVTSEILVGDSIYSGVTGYVGTDIVQTVIFNSPNTEVTMTTFAFVATGTGFMNDFTARPNYFVDFIIRTIGRDGVSDADLVINPRIEPFSDGTLTFDVSPYLSSELDPDPVPDLTDINDFFIKRDVRFFIKYRENWTGSSESQTLDSSFEFNALIAVKQIGEDNTMNLAEYVPIDDEGFPAKWLTDLTQPKFYPGFEFYLMFYFPETSLMAGTNNVRIEITSDGNGNYLADSSTALASHPEGVNYMKLAEGYDETVKFIDVFIANTAPQKSTNTTPGGDVRDIFFLEGTLLGWAVNENGDVINTTDGGQNWSLLINLGIHIIHRIFFVDEDNGFLVEDGGVGGLGVRKSIDGGISWSDITPVASQNWNALFVFNENVLMVARITTTSGAYISNDRGATWTEQKQVTNFVKNGIYFWNLNQGVLVGATGNVEYTENNGITWQTATVPGAVTENLLDVKGWENGIAIASGPGRVIRSTDFGKTWISVDTNAGGFFSKVISTSNNNLIYIAHDIAAKFLFTYDQGLTWAEETYTGGGNRPQSGATIQDRLHLGHSNNNIDLVGHLLTQIIRIKIIHEDCPSPFYIRFNNRRGGNTWWMFTLNQVFTIDDSKEEVLLEDDQLNDNEYEVLVQLNTPNEITDLSVRDLDGVKKLQEQGMIAVNQVDKEGNEIGLVILEQAQAKQSNSSVHQIDIIVQRPEKQRLL